MKKLKIDLELLVQSFSFNSEDLCKEYLDTLTGDIINIPKEVLNVAQGISKEDSLSDWEKNLLQEACSIAADDKNRYILIPEIEILYSKSDMETFTNEIIQNPELFLKLSNALMDKNPIRSFKTVLTYYPEELDFWYDYEEEKGIDLAIAWLNENGIEIINYSKI